MTRARAPGRAAAWSQLGAVLTTQVTRYSKRWVSNCPMRLIEWVRCPVPVATEWQCNDHWVAICCIGKLVPAAHLSEHRIRRSSRLSGSRAELRHCPGWSWSLGDAAFYFNISSITTHHSHDKASKKIVLFFFKCNDNFTLHVVFQYGCSIVAISEHFVVVHSYHKLNCGLSLTLCAVTLQ